MSLLRYLLFQSHWSLFFMVVSWSLVEVPRYTFYALNLYISQVPYPIFFLRYSLFFVLYPTGVLHSNIAFNHYNIFNEY